jgi:hypothetical protein
MPPTCGGSARSNRRSSISKSSAAGFERILPVGVIERFEDDVACQLVPVTVGSTRGRRPDPDARRHHPRDAVRLRAITIEREKISYHEADHAAVA